MESVGSGPNALLRSSGQKQYADSWAVTLTTARAKPLDAALQVYFQPKERRGEDSPDGVLPSELLAPGV